MITDFILYLLFAIPQSLLDALSIATDFVGPLPQAAQDTVRWTGEVFRIFDPLCPAADPCSVSLMTFLSTMLLLLVVGMVIRAIQLIVTVFRGVNVSHGNSPDMG